MKSFPVQNFISGPQGVVIISLVVSVIVVVALVVVLVGRQKA